ncbi:hypothetical protein BC939DRAFT_514794 [Gamsiella multidivaricata]|uniref:uncharacterized protein n=1 Tax=Gamsiella multidivaricata TaxID=101098 RepID=UPI00221FC4F3|nr:uncharacterized protein BC939DRAFT_514794 [Gamsiella multidivaricata]KAG0360739.1 hypothetical protein BGZ54_009400 [Gamsiella multidivaricata]KAI7826045.1 hypothetical protein BC939DRAFT_514794 [Gamsiella multidivaricata]
MTGCKVPSIKLPGKSNSTSVVRPKFTTRSTSTSSIPRMTTSMQIQIPKSLKEPSSAAINIPSPPLTPHMGRHLQVDDEDDDQEPNDHIFSSRFHKRLDEDEKDLSLMMRQSSSAPSAMSPLQMRSASNVPVGFTFSSNLLSPTQAKEERESYDVFVNTMEEDYWKSVSTIRTTYFFDGIGRGGGFLAIPHLASHGNAKTNVICRLLEAWLTKKLVEPTISDSIPVLEDNIQSSVQSIEQHLRQDPKVWSGISKSFIRIRCGHVFMLSTCCDDETIVHLGADEFYQDYPLFVDVEIKMHCDSNHLPKEHSTEVLIAFQNVVNRTKTKEEEKPYVHHAVIHQDVMSKRRQSQGFNTIA